MNWYLAVLKKYAVFDGRAQRAEYWFFVLINVVISIALSVVDGAIGTINPVTGVGFLGALYMLAVLLPGLGVTIRRLHDTDRSGWWILVALVPAVGFLILLVFMILDGSPGDNRFGSRPKSEAVSAGSG